MWAACAVPSSVTTPIERLFKFRIGQYPLNCIYDCLRFGGSDLHLSETTFDKYIDQKRVETFVRLRQSQWLDVTFIEFTIGIFNDGGDAAEVFPEHDRTARKDDASQVTDQLVRRHFGAEGLLGQKPVAKLFNLLFRYADRGRGDLLMVTYDQELLTP